MTAVRPVDIDISPITIEKEMRRSYLDYAMSVIVSRALPDVRDGLKPVQRRIIFSMNESGYHFNRPYRKSARIVGDVIGKYHPHGDSPIYEAMARMAQDFSMRLLLIDGQGNFGSMDGDPPAAMRYTEARLSRVAHELIRDIDKNTVDFQPNYDDSMVEPCVLPAGFPNLLVNGAGGIAVGMATNIPPHNLGEVLDACCAMIDNPDITSEELMQYILGPDFPTGALIMGRRGIYDAYMTGRGTVIMRGRAHTEEFGKDRTAIVITEVPYQVNKSRLVERMAEIVNEKVIEGISDLRDESDRDGVRVVVELKRDASADVVLNQLYHHTPLQTSFGVNTLALNHGRPQMMTLRDILKAFIEFRQDVITRRTRFELQKAQERAHVLLGLVIAVSHLDPVIELIRHAPDPVTAKQQLMQRPWAVATIAPYLSLVGEVADESGVYHLSEAQAKAILELRLQRLTGLERDKITKELEELGKDIHRYIEILQSPTVLFALMRQELVDIRTNFATPRRSEIEEGAFEHDIEALIQREDMVITVSHSGYIKRVPLSTYRSQRRGGKGRSGMSTREEDFVTDVFVASTHTTILFFSSIGKVYQLKTYRLPLGNPQSRGKALVNMLPIAAGERIAAIMALPEDRETWESMHVVFATSRGNIRRNALTDFVNIKSNGKIAMKLEDNENLVAVKVCNENQDILLSTQNGRAIRFNVDEVREFASRTSTGVRGIKLSGDDVVISMTILNQVVVDTEERDQYIRQANAQRRQEAAAAGVEDVAGGVEDIIEDQTALEEESVPLESLSPERFAELAHNEEFILTVTEKGFGKRTSAYEYRITGRGGMGITDIDVSARNGCVVAAFPVKHEDQIMLVTDSGKVIRCPVHDIRIAGRRTLGVRLFRIDVDERVVSVAYLGECAADEDVGEGETEA
jgi:DNA gyrase subunit A